MLSDVTIRKFLKSRKIIIVPEPLAGDFKSVGIKLHLGKKLLIPVKGQTVDAESPKDVKFSEKEIGNKGYVLRPGEFILGHTLQKYAIAKDMSALLDGRSTLARLGLTIHGTSQIVEADTEDPHVITLEIKNNGPFKLVLRLGMQIGMLCFFKLNEKASKNIVFNYRNQKTVLPPDMTALKER